MLWIISEPTAPIYNHAMIYCSRRWLVKRWDRWEDGLDWERLQTDRRTVGMKPTPFAAAERTLLSLRARARWLWLKLKYHRKPID